MSTRRQNVLMLVWVAVNALGIWAFLSFASVLWANGDQGTGQDSLGDSFYWISHPVPVLLLLLVVNISAVIAFRRLREAGTAKAATILFRGLAVVWVLVVLFGKYISQ